MLLVVMAINWYVYEDSAYNFVNSIIEESKYCSD